MREALTANETPAVGGVAAEVETIDMPGLVGSISRLFVGVDLGRQTDPTAIAVVRRVQRQRGVLSEGNYGMPRVIDDGEPEFQVAYLERVPLGTPYPGVVRHVGALLARPSLKGAELVIDLTGVGVAVGDIFTAAGLDFQGVTITAGDAPASDGAKHRVPKGVLISRLDALLHDGRLKIHKGLAEAPALIAELQNIQATASATGHWRFGARSGQHDDLVLALAIALWRAHSAIKWEVW